MRPRHASISLRDRQFAQELVAHYVKNRDLFVVMLNQLREAIHGSQQLMAHVHSTKWRLKDPKHLQGKLLKKIKVAKEKGKKFAISEDNLFRKINDLAGFRILHLHTQQIIPIDNALRTIFDEYRYSLIEEPTARTWDDEHRTFFKSVGIRPIRSPKMYTSVHYIIKSSSRTGGTCEIQVRTLAEELWGEVDHMLNYPDESPIRACREQIKVLARITSSCSRLVDSIFYTAQTNTAPHSGRIATEKSKR